eukprot:CAMPEP_0179440032 /NCGR_PEP_ID=MMETSP0799-20121207/23634_1 /TAXON_ID=46947 /ORGANISM="Geminigera cryophila, Strain CCMP2564" /LENGTH=228 /DNA_ID=CAMNT_0021222981 /DNA_START=49 /DNA_END=735 /DNA_ORIENTATION=-
MTQMGRLVATYRLFSAVGTSDFMHVTARTNRILSSSSRATSGYMPVMSLRHLKLEPPQHLTKMAKICSDGWSLHQCVNACRASFKTRLGFSKSKDMMPNLSLSMGWTGYVPQFETSRAHDDTALKTQEIHIIEHLHQLAQFTRAASENEVKAWLGFGDETLSEIDSTSSAADKANLVQQWFMQKGGTTSSGADEDVSISTGHQKSVKRRRGDQDGKGTSPKRSKQATG